MSSIDVGDVPFHKENTKKWIPNNSNTSQQALDVSYELLSNSLLKFDKNSDWSVVKNEICKKLQPDVLLQSFSLYAHVNDHKNWTQTIIRLNKLLLCLSRYESNSEEDTLVQDYAHTLIEALITKEMKVVYRALNNLRGAVTNPMLRLLQTIVKFGNGKYIDLFMSYFDFSLPSLNKILTPHKNELNAKQEAIMDEKQYANSLRYNFIQFFTDLLAYAPAILRKDLITENNKIMVNLSKYISKVDSDSCTMSLVDMFIEKVIRETTFKKATKCKIFHEFLLLNILKKYQAPETSLDCRKKIMEFFVLLFTNFELGMVFENSRPWGDTGKNENNTISVNGKIYKLKNKYIFNTISKFKPWEDEMQLNTLIRVLHSAPELVAPYLNQLNYINGNNEPKMTSFWIGQTLTLNKIINLPIPEAVLKEESETFGDDLEEETENSGDNNGVNYSIQILADIILPPSITSANLKQYVSSENKFIKHIGCQTIASILKKLDLIARFLKNQSSSNINFANELINRVQSKMPELQEYLKVIDSLYDENDEKQTNLLLVSEFTVILSLYTNLFTNLNNQFKLRSKNIYSALIAKGSSHESQLNGLELNIIDKYMQLQELNDSYKWWNKHNAEYSLFTSLLRMCANNSSEHADNSSEYTKRIVPMLENLVAAHKIFNKNHIVASPIRALLESLLAFKETDLTNIWKLIDQCVQRTISAPYKYIDMSVGYSTCSPIMCCFIEQLPYFTADAPETTEKKWLVEFMQKCYKLGDTGLKNLLLGADIIGNDLLEKHWTVKYDLNSTSSVSSLNDFCELVGSIDLFTSEELADGIQRIDQFLQQCSAKDIQKLSSSKIFDNALATAKNTTALTLLLKVLNSNNVSVNVTEKPAVFDHWVALLASSGPELSFCILNQLGKDAFSDILANKNFNIDSLQSPECMLLLLFKMLSFNIFEPKIVNSVLLKYGSFVPEEYYDVIFEKVNVSELLSESNKLVESKLFLQKIVSRYPSQASQYFKNCFANHSGNRTDMLIFFASLVPDTGDADVTSALLNQTFSYIDAKDDRSVSYILSFATKNISLISSEFKEKLTSAVNYLAYESKIRYTGSIIEFITNLVKLSAINFDVVKVWYYKLFVYINKKSAIIGENEADGMSQFLQTFLKTSEMIRVINPWLYIPKVVLNTSIDIVLLQKWAFKKEVIEFFVTLCEQSSDEMFETKKAIQFVFNNEHNPFRITPSSTENIKLVNLTSVLLSSFYYKNVKSNADVNIALQFVENYEGTTSIKDRIFYNILQSIESQTSTSWTQRIGSWDFIDESQDADEDDEYAAEKLIVKEKELLSVNINKHMVTATINNYRLVEKNDLPSECVSFFAWETILANELLLSENNPVIYDTRFIMLLILHNKDLVDTVAVDKEEEQHVSKFNFKSLIKTGLFSLILVSLGYNDDENSSIAFQILQHMVNTLPKTEDENSRLKVDLMVSLFLKKIMFTFAEDKQQSPATFAPPIFWFILSQIALIILEPRHFLYEQVYKWLLSKPKLVKYELPVMNMFINFHIKTQDFENFNKSLNWLLKNLILGLKTVEDINYLKLIKMFDFLLNFSNNCYCTRLTATNLTKFIQNLQRVLYDYSIITRYGILGSLEARKYVDDFKMQSKKTSADNYKDYLVILQESLNIKELSLRFGVQLTASKRLLDWTEGDGLRMIKRVCK